MPEIERGRDPNGVEEIFTGTAGSAASSAQSRKMTDSVRQRVPLGQSYVHRKKRKVSGPILEDYCVPLVFKSEADDDSESDAGGKPLNAWLKKSPAKKRPDSISSMTPAAQGRSRRSLKATGQLPVLADYTSGKKMSSSQRLRASRDGTPHMDKSPVEFMMESTANAGQAGFETDDSEVLETFKHKQEQGRKDNMVNEAPYVSHSHVPSSRSVSVSTSSEDEDILTHESVDDRIDAPQSAGTRHHSMRPDLMSNKLFNNEPGSLSMKKVLIRGMIESDDEESLPDSPSKTVVHKDLQLDSENRHEATSTRKQLFADDQVLNLQHGDSSPEPLRKNMLAEDDDTTQILGVTRSLQLVGTPSKKTPNASLNLDSPKKAIFTLPTLEVSVEHVNVMKFDVLRKLNRRTALPVQQRTTQFSDVHSLLRETIVRSESNSAILFGPRGSGKSLLVQEVLQKFHDEKHEFLTVRLDGLTQTDDRMALRALARQLQPDHEDIANADIMTALLAILAHPRDFGETDEPMSTIIVLDHFEKFTEHPRQTLLYNLFDIAQSKKAPVCVLGLTSRVDAYDSLEKRVKSRFSHRVIQFNPLSFNDFMQLAVSYLKSELVAAQDIQLSLYQAVWNKYMDECPGLRDFLRYCYLTTPDVRVCFCAIIPIISQLGCSPANAAFPSFVSLLPEGQSQGKLDLLESLTSLELSLVIAAARLEVKGQRINFATSLEEYKQLAHKSTISQRMSGITNVRIYGKQVCLGAWQALLEKSMIVPLGRGSASMDFKLVRLEVRLFEILGYFKAGKIKLGGGMQTWLSLG